MRADFRGLASFSSSSPSALGVSNAARLRTDAEDAAEIADVHIVKVQLFKRSSLDLFGEFGPITTYLSEGGKFQLGVIDSVKEQAWDALVA